MELTEELVIKVVAVGQHHERGVLHRWMPHHACSEEEHGKALAAALGMPDDPCTPVTRLAAALVPGPIIGRAFAQDVAIRGNAASPYGFFYRRVDRMELMVTRDDLVHRPRIGVFFENNKMVQQVEKSMSLEDAPDERLQFQGSGCCIVLSIDRAPDLEPFLVGRYGAHSSL